MEKEIFNTLGIIVKYKEGKGIDYVLEMGETYSLCLRPEKTLFDGVSTTKELIARFNDGFSDPWDEGRDFNANIENWDDGTYKKFITKLKKKDITDIGYVCLFVDEAFTNGERRYSWAKYEFNGIENNPKFSMDIVFTKEPEYYISCINGLKYVKELIGG